MRTLFILFIVMPILEMWLLITVGQQIGALPTIGLVLLTAFIGISLLRYQGAMTMLKARMKMDAGEMPAREMADGLFFAVGGALLLTPGFVTDAIGFACLTPGIRTWVIRFLSRHVLQGNLQGGLQGNVQTHFYHGGGSHQPHSGQNSTKGEVLEGEFKRETPTKGE